MRLNMTLIYLKHAPNPLEARLCPAEIVGPCASTPVDMHKIDEE
jgi:hypothetical protein